MGACPSPVGMGREHGEDASAAAFQFSIGGGILMVLVSTGLVATQDLGRDDSAAHGAVEDARSASLLAVALSGSWSWSEGGSQTETGFLAEDGGLKMDAMTLFKGAQWTGLQNHAIDYSEARAEWGVGQAEDFHLRIVPIDSTTIYDLSGLRVAYIAPWQDVGDIHVASGTDEEMLAATRAHVDASMAAAAAHERAVLASLGVDYDNRAHVTASSPAAFVDVSTPAGVVSVPLVSRLGGLAIRDGDVYLADVDHLHSSLAGRWHEYDVVVIGSGAQHEALAQGSFPAHARQHVDGGGLLVLLGGTQDTTWLEDALGGAAATANQQRSTPDHGHPLLSWPSPFDRHALGSGPPLPAAAVPDAAWQHVLGTSDHVDLAVSQHGSLGDGVAVLTSLQPEGQAGQTFLTNVLGYYARQDTHLDFGQVLPGGIPVSGAQRIMWGSDAGGNQVALRVQLLYWGG